ncbi:TPA: Abi family protein, partial [Streptococcus suis]
QTNTLKYKNYKKVNDLLSLFSLARTYCSQPVRDYQKQFIKEFVVRARRNEEDYRRNVELTKMMVIFERIVDIL